MSQHIYKCVSCSSYTIEEKCSKCGEKAILPRPPKFSLDDKYAHLKREAKKEGFRKKGLY